MTEQQTPVMTPPAAPPAAPTGPKKKRKGRGKTIAGILIVAAIAIAPKTGVRRGPSKSA